MGPIRKFPKVVMCETKHDEYPVLVIDNGIYGITGEHAYRVCPLRWGAVSTTDYKRINCYTGYKMAMDRNYLGEEKKNISLWITYKEFKKICRKCTTEELNAANTILNQFKERYEIIEAL